MFVRLTSGSGLNALMKKFGRLSSLKHQLLLGENNNKFKLEKENAIIFVEELKP